MKNTLKKTAAFLFAFTLVAAPLTQTAGTGGLFERTAIVAKADVAKISNLYVGNSDEIKAAGALDDVGQTSGSVSVSVENDTIVLELTNFNLNTAGYYDSEYSIRAAIFYEGNVPLTIRLNGTNTITTNAVETDFNFGIISFK